MSKKNKGNNFFARLNKKQAQEFQSLADEQKADIVASEINKRVSHVLNQRVSIAFMKGYMYAFKMLKENYVDKNVTGDEYNALIAEMFEEIQKNADKYEKYKSENKEK